MRCLYRFIDFSPKYRSEKFDLYRNFLFFLVVISCSISVKLEIKMFALSFVGLSTTHKQICSNKFCSCSLYVILFDDIKTIVEERKREKNNFFLSLIGIFVIMFQMISLNFIDSSVCLSNMSTSQTNHTDCIACAVQLINVSISLTSFHFDYHFEMCSIPFRLKINS